MALHKLITTIVILTTILLIAAALSGAESRSALDSRAALGEKIFFTKISNPSNQSCASCHAPKVGFVGQRPAVNAHAAVYPGAIRERTGNRKPPSAGYATLSPRFHYSHADRLFEGGNFWDGRATGWELGNPAADQAQGPFLNPVEQNNASERAVCKQIASNPEIRSLFETVWGERSLNCNTSHVSQTYDRIALSIAAYEDSRRVNAFSSKFDAWRKGTAKLTASENRGWVLFNGQGKCSQCHVLAHADEATSQDLFTDFTFDNLGIPRNPENRWYKMDAVTLDNGNAINPDGDAWIDPGLGGFLASLANPANQGWRSLPYVTNVNNFSNKQLVRLAAANFGKHRVPTLRNVDKRANTNLVKAYGHNGYFKSLWSVVHFYNTRDVKPACVDAMTTEKEALAKDCWPAAEVSENVNHTELGNLGLTRDEERDIVSFLKTLSDGWSPRQQN